MNVFYPFLTGFLAAVVGILPPGLINMSAAKVSLTDGKKRAMMFVLGALIVIVLQTYISLVFARYISQHEEVVVLLRQIGLGIFIALTVYFFFFAKKPEINTDDTLPMKSKRSRFFMGMLISALNFFPIPYYVFVGVTAASYRIFDFSMAGIVGLVAGVLGGSFAVFYCYVVFFGKLKGRTIFFVANMNRIIGTITGLVALFTVYNILK